MTSRKSNFILYLVATTFFMETLDSTVIATALPKMAEDFGVAAVDVGIGITAYLLTLAALIPISGWLADRFGTRNIFTLAIIIFTASSVLCGLSENLWFFTLSRVLQGMGGALMVPVGRIIVLRNTKTEDIIRAVGLITWPGLIGPVVGPAIGGFLTSYATWHWIFFINVPIGIIGIYLSWVLIEPYKAEQQKPLDYLGFIYTGTALSSLIYAIELSRKIQETQILCIFFILLGLTAGVLSIRHLKRAQNPMIDLSLLSIPTFRITLWVGLWIRTALSAIPFLIPLYLQIGLGIDPFIAGLLVLSVFIGNLIMKAFTTPMLNRYGFKKIMTINGYLVILSFLVCAFITKDTPFWLMALILFMNGLFRSLQFTSINTLALADVPKPQMSSASALTSTAMQISMALGIAVGSLILTLASIINQGDAQTPLIQDFRLSFVLITLLPICSLWNLRLLSKDAGDTLRKAKN
ncbi:DHA2 family efflux MFS transporter permease subunit [Polynucleobacter kasalickyi]|uniref:Drug resistance transporter, EmrB/QacA subfamily n=1 Tax=Polynucleobacter kasalickyi TaxID=1938817 RepID=A0A1W2C806_9BURK|nr:DHA2 family efflux MFS transporter permease subunit [Polynucleobacter kasalickyi]SMC81385.1 drug resistance transporter, EmrB/QacA subfamily [Polynucleobacter kasalickyi]